MADMGFEIEGIDDFIKELEELGNLDAYAPELLQAAAPILEEKLKQEVHSAANRGYATGKLAGSIKAGKPSQNQYGHYVSVSAKGKDAKGVRNNEKLAYLHYGTSKQAARPVLTGAVKKAEKGCLEAMQRKLDEVIDR